MTKIKVAIHSYNDSCQVIPKKVIPVVDGQDQDRRAAGLGPGRGFGSQDLRRAGAAGGEDRGEEWRHRGTLPPPPRALPSTLLTAAAAPSQEEQTRFTIPHTYGTTPQQACSNARLEHRRKEQNKEEAYYSVAEWEIHKEELASKGHSVPNFRATALVFDRWVDGETGESIIPDGVGREIGHAPSDL